MIRAAATRLVDGAFVFWVQSECVSGDKLYARDCGTRVGMTFVTNSDVR